MSKKFFDAPIEIEQQKHPSPVYFIPVISYTILVITHFIGLKIPLGVSLAYVGVASITPSVQTLVVLYGLSTDKWYDLVAKGDNIAELFILSIFGLIAIQFSAFLVGQSTSPLPSYDMTFWFILGFVGFVGMNESFMYFYDNDTYNIPIAFLMSMLLGLAYIIFASMLGGV